MCACVYPFSLSLFPSLFFSLFPLHSRLVHVFESVCACLLVRVCVLSTCMHAVYQAIDGLLPSILRADGILSSFNTLLRTCPLPSSHLLSSLRNT
jgi:hypothetical protein